MRTFSTAPLLAVAALCLALPLAAPTAAQEAAANRLTVTGTGMVSGIPDLAVLTLGVTSRGDTAAQAMDATSVATADVLALLAETGVSDTDMQTSDLSLSPVWSNRNSVSGGGDEITGFRASNTVTVRIRDLDGMGEVLDAAINAGANEFRELRFALQNPAPAMDEARRLAVAEARARAETYAEAAGIVLGDVLELTESGGGGGPIMMREAAIASAVPIAAGEVDTTASVTIVFEISGP